MKVIGFARTVGLTSIRECYEVVSQTFDHFFEHKQVTR